MLFGVLNLNKPQGLTSRDIVNQVVRCCPRRTKVGHAGTLDPLATGVLVVAVGPATKLIQYVQQSSKTYVGSFRLGLCSDTEDISGAIETIPDGNHVQQAELEKSLGGFIGHISQTPPQYSAVKVDGQRAYKAARRGQVTDIQPRTVRIDALKLLQFNYPDFQIEIVCGKGTYVRTLGRDISRSLGTDCVMTSLQRTAIGPFDINDALTMDEFDAESLKSKLLDPMSMVSHLPSVEITSEEIERLRHGQQLGSEAWEIEKGTVEIAVIDSSRRLLAVLERKSEDAFRSKLNFVPQLY